MRAKKSGFSILIFVLTFGIASAGEFRALKFGESCDGIIEKERARGSRIDFAKSQVEKISAEYLGREAAVGYMCDSENRLIHGSYQYEFVSYQAAARFFANAQGLLTAQFGVPSQDSTTHEMKAVRKNFPYSNLGESVLWIDGDQLVALGLLEKTLSSKDVVLISFKPRHRRN